VTNPTSDQLTGIPLGRPFGVPLRLSGSWFIGAALIAWIFEPAAQRWLLIEPPASVVVAASFAVLLGLSVLAHELAHAVAAQRFGLHVRSMTIHLLGGVTAMDAETRRPWVDFVIAGVGPLASLALGGLAWLGHLVVPEGSVFSFITWQLAFANIIVGVFNLVPALPLDGGRLLRDVVWAASGKEYLGTTVAGWIGRAFAVLVAALAVLPTLLGSSDLIWLAWGLLLAGFIWFEAGRSLAAASVSRAVETVTAAALMRPGHTVASDTPLSLALASIDDRSALLVVNSAGQMVGIVQPDAAEAVPPARRPWVPVSSVSVSHSGRPTIPYVAAGRDLWEMLAADPSPVHLVGGPDGTVYGVLFSADVVEAVGAGRL
jgi:Zn-dependent protease